MQLDEFINSIMNEYKTKEVVVKLEPNGLYKVTPVVDCFAGKQDISKPEFSGLIHVNKNRGNKWN